MSLPPSKLSQIRDALADGREVDALRIAARFPELGEHRDVITRGWAAHSNPSIYRAMGHDPVSLVTAAIAAIRARYRL